MFNDIFAYDGKNTLAFVVMGIFVGTAVACFIMLYNIKLPGKLVRALSKLGANSPERAVSASECGFKSEFILRFMLSENGALAKYVRIIPNGKENGEKTPKDRSARSIRLSEASFYLEESTRIRAELRYDKKNANTLTVIVGILLLLILALAMLIIIPDLMQMLENFIGMFAEK